MTSVHNTVADNIVSPSAHSFYVMEGAALLGGWDVIDQPQALMFVDAAAASVALQTVMAPNAIGAPPGTVLQTTPIFAGGNTYRLDSSSPGIDYADPALGGQVDIDGANRNVDHPLRGVVSQFE